MYIAGKTNTVADALSRIGEETNAISFKPLITESEVINQQDEEVLRLKKDKKARLIQQDGIWYEVSNPERERVVIPENFRQTCFNHVHKNHHPGIKKTYKLLKDQVIWKGMNLYVKQMIENCKNCQLNKNQRHPKLAEICFKDSQKLDTFHIDIVGPLPPNNNYKYLLTDRKSVV